MKFYRHIAITLISAALTLILLYFAKVDFVSEMTLAVLLSPLIALVAVTFVHLWVSLYTSVEVLKTMLSVLYADYMNRNNNTKE